MAIQRLTAAYRSRSRPSSTLGAKASTMCPYYLDGELLPDTSAQELGFFPLCAPPMSMGNAKNALCTKRVAPSGAPSHKALGLVQFSRSTEASGRGSPAGVSEN